MNILIVESENDEYFIQALAKKISLDNKVCHIDKYERSSLDSEGKNLTLKIVTTLTKIIGRGVSKIGILLDLDNATHENRIELLNKCLRKALIDIGFDVPNTLLTNVKEFITIPIDGLEVKIACYFTNIDGKGELETVLKAIKSKDSVFADCLYDGWQKCLEQKGKTVAAKGEQGDISDKEILKLWIDFYKRFDTLKKSERNEESTDWKGIMLGETTKGKKLENVRGEDIFNLQSDSLTDIMSFLEMFD